MAVRPKNGTWMVDFMVAGTRYREFAFASEQEAGAWEVGAREAVKRGQPLPYKGPTRITGASWGPKPGRCLTMRELVRHCAKVHWSSRKSADKLIHNADLFADFHGPETPAQDALSARGVADYVLSLQDGGRSGSTVNRHLSAVSVLAKHALALNALTVLPLLPWQREAEGRLRWFTDAEEAAILATLADWGQERYRDFFIFLADTGARVGEAEKFDWECIGGNGRLVTFWETKNGHHRTVPMTTRVREAVQRRRGAVTASMVIESLRRFRNASRSSIAVLASASVRLVYMARLSHCGMNSLRGVTRPRAMSMKATPPPGEELANSSSVMLLGAALWSMSIAASEIMSTANACSVGSLTALRYSRHAVAAS